jgi:hypothetical protein
MLEMLSDGDAPEAALRRSMQVDYAEVEHGLGLYLAKNAR